MENKTSGQFEAVSVPLCKEVSHNTLYPLSMSQMAVKQFGPFSDYSMVV